MTITLIHTRVALRAPAQSRTETASFVDSCLAARTGALAFLGRIELTIGHLRGGHPNRLDERNRNHLRWRSTHTLAATVRTVARRRSCKESNLGFAGLEGPLPTIGTGAWSRGRYSKPSQAILQIAVAPCLRDVSRSWHGSGSRSTSRHQV